jgi:hypothetical protein
MRTPNLTVSATNMENLVEGAEQSENVKSFTPTQTLKTMPALMQPQNNHQTMRKGNQGGQLTE